MGPTVSQEIDENTLLQHRVHTGKIVQNSRSFQGLLEDFPTVFKDWKLKKNTDLHVKILLLKC